MSNILSMSFGKNDDVRISVNDSHEKSHLSLSVVMHQQLLFVLNHSKMKRKKRQVAM